MINEILWPIYGKAGAMYNNFMAMGGVMILSFFLIGCVMLFNQIREGDCLAFGKHVWKLLMTVILLFEFLTLAGLTAWAIEGISIKIMTDKKVSGEIIKKIGLFASLRGKFKKQGFPERIDSCPMCPIPIAEIA